MSIFTKFWADLVGIFNEAKKLWLEYEPKTQTAILDASGILATINANLDKTPQVVFELLQAKWPSITIESLHSIINTAASTLKVEEKIVASDFYTTLQNLQTYLAGFTGAAWESETQQWVGIIAIIFSPETPLQKVVAVLEWVYQKFVKK